MTQPETTVDNALLGEIIRVEGHVVLCWMETSPGQRIKVGLPVGLFDQVPLVPGVRFRQEGDECVPVSTEAEDRQIAIEGERLSREWEDGVKDVELHTGAEDRPTRPEKAWPGVLVAVLVAALLGAVLVACVGCGDDYRQQSLAVSEAETIGELPSGLPGVALYVPLQGDCTLEVTLGDDVNGSWRLIRAAIQKYSETDGRWLDVIYAGVCAAFAQGEPSTVWISDLAPDARYRVKLELEPKGSDITDYFNTRAGPAKDAKLDHLYGPYWLRAKELVGSVTVFEAVTVLARPGVEEVKARVH